MHSACVMVQCMGHIQIRNVPEDVHRTLKARAAKAGMSLSEYLLRGIVEDASRPTLQEMTERIRSRPPADLGGVSTAEIIREEREARDQHLADVFRADR
jgi:antitoxin FitA